MLSVWLLSDESNFLNSSGSFVVGAMLRALRVHSGQTEAVWQSANLAVGLLELPEAEPIETIYAPAVSADGRFWLWMAGEAFDGGGWIEFTDATETRTLAFRQRLLATMLAMCWRDWDCQLARASGITRRMKFTGERPKRVAASKARS